MPQAHAAQPPPLILILTGGEPLLRPDVYELAARGTQLGLRVVLATCGSLLDDATVSRLLAAGVRRVSISLDGASAETHDAFRGVPGAFDGAMRGIAAARRGGLEFQVNTTVTRDNRDELPAILDLARRLGAVTFNPFLLVPTGRGREMADRELSPTDYERTLAWLSDREDDAGLPIRVTCAPHYQRIRARRRQGKRGQAPAGPTTPPSGASPLFPDAVRDRSEGACGGYPHARGGPHAVSGGCLGGKSFAFVSHDGKVRICGFLDVDAGDLREVGMDFGSIWETAELFRRVRDVSGYGGKCGACEYVRTCGGCRARAYAMTGDYLAEEPFCLYRPAAMRTSERFSPGGDEVAQRAPQLCSPGEGEPFSPGGEDVPSEVEGQMRGRLEDQLALDTGNAPSTGAGRGACGPSQTSGRPLTPLAALGDLSPGGEGLEPLSSKGEGSEPFPSKGEGAEPSPSTGEGLDAADRAMLTAAQEGLAIVERPFEELARRVGLAESQVLDRLRSLQGRGLVRRIGAVFDSRRLGYATALVAARVPTERLDRVAAVVSEHPGVTHNYARDHAYRLWFTLAAPSPEALRETLGDLRERTGVAEMYLLPATRTYKIRVALAPTGNGEGDPRQSSEEPADARDGGSERAAERKTPQHRSDPHHARCPVTPSDCVERAARTQPVTESDKRLVRAMEELPLIERPFAEAASRGGLSEAEVLERLRAWQRSGVLRRLAALVAHRRIGYSANGMAVLRVPPAHRDAAGALLAARPQVTHCFARPSPPGMDFNLYAMFHGAAPEEVRAAVADAIADIARVVGEPVPHELLFSTREFKKTSMRYFTEPP